MKLGLADMSAPDLIDLIEFHVAGARQQCATHVYDRDRLVAENVIMFTARETDGRLMGMAGLKDLGSGHGEIKSVRTHPDFLRRGISAALMEYLTEYAKDNGFNRLSLETHPTEKYVPACALYEKLGYEYCAPFGDYKDTGESIFMTKEV